MNAFFSRYSITFVKSLVYMLQQSEYDTKEYLSWFKRTGNFNEVMRRKQLDMTSAAKGFLAFLGLEIAVGGIAVLMLGFSAASQGWFLGWIVGVIIIGLLVPYVLAYGLVAPLWLARILIQRPRQKAQIARARSKLVDHPATKIAIAGSYGKTTMKETLAMVLGTAKKVAATPGNMNTPAGISRFVEELTGDEEILIFEMGEYYPGDIAVLCELVQPNLGIITGINEAHLSKFKSLDATVATIFELADYFQDKDQNLKNTLYTNGESHLAARGPADSRADAPALIYSRGGVGKWKVERAHTGLDGTSFNLKRGKEVIKVSSLLLGLHQVGPLAAAAAIAAWLGLSLTDIEAGLARTKPFEHRLQPAIDAGGVITIDDTYNGNPDGARVAIEFLASLEGRKRYYVTPGLVEMGYRTRDVHVAMGKQLAESGIEVVVLIETSVMPHIKAGLETAGFKGKLMTYPDEITALMALPKLTTEGDVVLLQNDWGDNYS